MQKLLLTTMIAGMALATPALAQTPPAPTAPEAPAAEAPAVTNAPAAVKAGDTVYDPAGNTVGTIEAINGTTANLTTGTVTVGIPLAGIVTRDKGPTIALTKEQVEAQAKGASPTPG